MRVPPAFAARKTAPPPPQPVKVSGTQKTLMGFGSFGVFLLVSHFSTERENEAEKVRVKKESKKMKNMEKEFTDIDAGVDADNVRRRPPRCHVGPVRLIGSRPVHRT